ncbi:serine threonine kinase [Fusarium longipes]|uniref:Serine threonine kinase n=1 Tax=Fusarium longipes TaxID=694270 RepID=A0A395SVA6_9HYPO|nr:serine threonine kinase [Fusarium longipes]
MASHRLQDERHEEFFQFISRERLTGIDGNNEKSDFVSPRKVAKWWKEGGGNRIARAISHINVRAATIEKAYLNIFSILVYSSKTYLIKDFISHGFQDQHLPLLDPKRFGEDHVMVSDMEEFCENQWMFCPVVFSNTMPMDKRAIPSRQILPIKDEKRTMSKANHSKSDIRVVTLYPDCYDEDWSSSPTVVFKEYRTLERSILRDSWVREHDAFVKIDSCEHIVQYLGSFEQSGRCIMILEYAPGGSLLELFRRDQPPETPEQRRYFLYGMMGLVKAVDKIQNLGGGLRSQRTGFAHRDIKPANILVYPGMHDFYSAGFTMKLADFDTATPGLPIDEAPVGPQDNDGDKTYCAPEASRVYTYEDKTIRQLSLSSDIWSLGCVFSESLVWVAGGMAAVNKAANDRRIEIQTHHSLQIPAGLGDCFHNTQTALHCVLGSQQAAIEKLSIFTNLSGTVCTLVRQKMLVPVKERASPKDLWYEFNIKYEYLFSLGRTKSAPTRPQSQKLDTELSSPVSVDRSSRRSTQINQPLHQRTTSNPAAERPMITNSDHAQTDPSPLGLHTRVPLDSGVSIQQNSPVTRIPGEMEQISGFDRVLEPSTGGLGASQTITNNSPQAASPIYRHSIYTSPIDSPWDPNRLHPKNDQQGPSSLYGAAITVEDVIRHRAIKANKRLLPGYDQFRGEIGKRHFIFIIDDSDSMRALKDDVLKVVEVLIRLVKDIDLACPEIRFTSKPNKRYPSAIKSHFYTTDRLISSLRHWEHAGEVGKQCNMRHALNQIFSDANIVDPEKPTSVLIFTNGIWEGGDVKDGVEKCIENVIGKMRSKGVSDTGFTFQFVSFGDDQDGLNRMTYLDDRALFGGTTENRV